MEGKETPIYDRKVIKGVPEIAKRALRVHDSAIQNRRVVLDDNPVLDAKKRGRRRRIREHIASEFDLPPRYKQVREELSKPIEGNGSDQI